MENMDLAPYLLGRGRWGYRMGDGQLYDSMLRDGLNDAFSNQASGWHTEDLVCEFQVSREAPVGIAVAAALRRGPGSRQVRGRDRCRRDSRPQGTDRLRDRRAQPAGNNARRIGGAETGLSPRWDNYRRQRTGAHSPYLDRPLLPLALALPRILQEIEAALTTAGPAEARRLRQRAQLIFDLLAPKAQSPIPS
jgi:hypothetical protein